MSSWSRVSLLTEWMPQSTSGSIRDQQDVDRPDFERAENPLAESRRAVFRFDRVRCVRHSSTSIDAHLYHIRPGDAAATIGSMDRINVVDGLDGGEAALGAYLPGAMRR